MIKLANGCNSTMAMMVPITLNRVCNPAVLLADNDQPNAAKIPVTVVPMLLPKTNGNTAINVIPPAS